MMRDVMLSFSVRWLLVGALVMLMSAGARAAEQDLEELPSPDGRFVLRHVEDESFGVVEKATGRKVMLGKDETVEAFRKQLKGVWSRDSRRLALNYLLGTRFFTTRLYRLEGDQFAELPWEDSLIENRLDKDRKAELRRMKLAPNVYLRRIWDTYRTLRWVDARTVEVFTKSERYYYANPDSGDGDSVLISWVYTVRFDKAGKSPSIIDRRAPTAKEAKDSEE